MLQVIQICDLAKQSLVPVSSNEARRQLVAMGFRTLPADAAIVAGGEPLMPSAVLALPSGWRLGQPSDTQGMEAFGSVSIDVVDPAGVRQAQVVTSIGFGCQTDTYVGKSLYQRFLDWCKR